LSRVKLVRFADNQTRPDVVEPGKAVYKTLGGRWNEVFFQTASDTPITLEVGCGKGHYTIGLAQQFPVGNFIGLDVKGERLWTGSTVAQEAAMRNVGWLRGHALELPDHFAPAELAGIWITFPDPHPKSAAVRRRLTAPRFLDIYRQLLRPGGRVRLKTDSDLLFDYTLTESLSTQNITDLRYTRDLYGPDGEALRADTYGIQTHYETRFLREGKAIHFLEFAFVPMAI
jgi:tRNA (guanine-N7-)-methyltransferase